MAGQTNSGYAWEYALITSLSRLLTIQGSNVNLVQCSSLINKQAYFQSFNSARKARMELAANVAANHLQLLEPRLLHQSCPTDILELKVNTGSAGSVGDVRDIIVSRLLQNWEIGISAKNNHTAVKHSRLSTTIDFGAKWLGVNCSANYFNTIIPIFQNLNNLRQQGLAWSTIHNIGLTIYRPVLTAFMVELMSINQNNLNIPQKLASYLIGNTDFYKIIRKPKVVEFLGLKINGTINKRLNNTPPISVSQLRLPTQIIQLSFKPNSNNTLSLVCNNGWTFSMRIHNASSLIEPSLKFDIQLVGSPSTVYSHHLTY